LHFYAKPIELLAICSCGYFILQQQYIGTFAWGLSVFFKKEEILFFILIILLMVKFLNKNKNLKIQQKELQKETFISVLELMLTYFLFN